MNSTIAKNNCPVGFFDSGVGGLTVYAKFKHKLPQENCIYYGDTVHNPYGEKSKAELVGYARHILNFFDSQNVKSVVIACNTSSAIAYNVVKNDYKFKIYPIIQSCAKVISQLPIKRLGIFATKATIQSGVYESEIKKYKSGMQIFSQSCPKWVNIVENMSQDAPDNLKIIESDIKLMMKNKPDKILFGCTHYPYLIDILSKYTEKSLFIDPAVYFVDYVYNDLKVSGLLNKSGDVGSEEFFVSSSPSQFKKSANMFYSIKHEPQLLLFN